MGKIFYIMGKSAAGKDRIYSLLAGNKELNLKKLVLYTTRPIRAGEQDGVQYYFTDDSRLEEFKKSGKLIEARAYHTVHGIWTYFTADDGQVDLSEGNYLGIGTLESYQKLKQYYGEEHVIPVYIEVEDGGAEIVTAPSDMGVVRDALAEKYTISSAEVSMVPQTMTELTEEGQINAMTKLLDMLEDNDDVQDVYHNWDMPSED